MGVAARVTVGASVPVASEPVWPTGSAAAETNAWCHGSDGVSRTYGERRTPHPLHLDVAAGACTALFGRNRSGKSTLLRIADDRDRPT